MSDGKGFLTGRDVVIGENTSRFQQKRDDEAMRRRQGCGVSAEVHIEPNRHERRKELALARKKAKGV